MPELVGTVDGVRFLFHFAVDLQDVEVLVELFDGIGLLLVVSHELPGVFGGVGFEDVGGEGKALVAFACGTPNHRFDLQYLIILCKNFIYFKFTLYEKIWS